MAKIYTRTGDDGTTGLFGGPRVRKNAPRVAAYGDVDELNSCLGVTLAGDVHGKLLPLLVQVQHELFDLGGELASPDPDRMKTRSLGTAQIERLEREIDDFSSELPPLRAFILPGGTPLAAQLHIARTVCRRAERSVLSLADAEPQSNVSLPVVYLNRLSDWLFVAARYANFASGVADVAWRPTSQPFPSE